MTTECCRIGEVIGRGLFSDDQRELLGGRIWSVVDEAMA
jgi:hypothetical protein